MKNTNTEQISEKNQKDTSESQVFSLKKWWELSNAKYFRNKYAFYTPFIFSEPYDYEKAFGKILDEFFYGYGNWRHIGSVETVSTFPEIHVSFLRVEVFGLRENWNRRDLKLKDIMLSKFRKSFVDYAAEKNYNFSHIGGMVITDIWWIDDILFLEIPDSPFPIHYPHMLETLGTEEYFCRKKILDTRSKL